MKYADNRHFDCDCKNIHSCSHEKGDCSAHFEYTRVVPGDVRDFDIQAATKDCIRWHHVFSAQTEAEARAIERYVRYAGADIYLRASHKGCTGLKDE